MSAASDHLDDFEVALLLESIERRWGYDFKGYAQASLKRRIRETMVEHNIAQISELIPRVLHDPVFFEILLRKFSIPVTEMFRDPSFWLALKNEILPMLTSHAYFKVWHAACASGEEVYSLAILLEEAGLLPRATIYATDFNDEVLQKGRDGIYPIANLQKASQRYQKAGGEHSLNRYYLAQNDVVQMSKPLRDAITWANHNLTIDQVFGEMNLIFCRNALIYFTQPLQNRALDLFTKSLARGGVLCLGNKESLQFSSVSAQYLTLSKDERIYRLNPADDPLQTRAERSVRTRPRVRGAASANVARVPGVCVIGGSLGSLALLRELLRALPADFPLPILIVTHQSPDAPNALVEMLSPDCALAIKEAVAGDIIQPGTVYLSAPGYHLLLEVDWSLAFSSEPPDRHARPAINLLLESVATVCAKQAIGIILTGLNDDGASGLAALQAAGGTCLVQDPAEAVASSMPLAAIKACALSPQHVLPLAQLVDALKRQAALLAVRG